LSTLSYWKISPPLIREILVIRSKGIECHAYFFVQIMPVLWKIGSGMREVNGLTAGLGDIAGSSTTSSRHGLAA